MLITVSVNDDTSMIIDTQSTDWLSGLLSSDFSPQQQITIVRQVRSQYIIKNNKEISVGGWTLLQHACSLGRYDLAKMLLLQGANPNERDTSNAPTALILAVSSNNPNVNLIKLLLMFRADVSLTAKNPLTGQYYKAKSSLGSNVNCTNVKKEEVGKILDDPLGWLSRQSVACDEITKKQREQKTGETALENPFFAIHQYLCRKYYEKGDFQWRIKNFTQLLIQLKNNTISNVAHLHKSNSGHFLNKLCAPVRGDRYNNLVSKLRDLTDEQMKKFFDEYIVIVEYFGAQLAKEGFQERYKVDMNVIQPLYKGLMEKVEQGSRLTEDVNRRRSTFRNGY